MDDMMAKMSGSEEDMKLYLYSAVSVYCIMVCDNTGTLPIQITKIYFWYDSKWCARQSEYSVLVRAKKLETSTVMRSLACLTLL